MGQQSAGYASMLNNASGPIQAGTGRNPNYGTPPPADAYQQQQAYKAANAGGIGYTNPGINRLTQAVPQQGQPATAQQRPFQLPLRGSFFGGG